MMQALTQAPMDVPAGQTSSISSAKLQKAQEAAQDFESVFIAEMIKPMFEGIETEGPFGGGKGEEVFRGMLVQEYGKILSKSGSIGITNAVRDQMIAMQSQADSFKLSAKPQPSAHEGKAQ
jgi:Rod binding domain-containing protein